MSTSSVFVFDPSVPPNPERKPSLVWISPMSMFADEVAAIWAKTPSIDSLSAISGPWAAVLWQPSTARYVIAHDPVGVQPIFWARTTRGHIAVSSWVAALVDRDDIDDSPDYDGVLLGELGNSIPEVQHHSYFAAVSRVPWGHAVAVTTAGDALTQRVWDPLSLPGVDKSLSLDECAERLRDVIDAAVHRLVVPGVRTAAHVSGGLDCTTMACRADQILKASGESLVEGFSWAPDERVTPRFDGDERSIVEDASRAQRFPVSFNYPDETGDWFAVRDRFRYPNTTHAREAYVLPRAAQLGVEAMFSGWGGDELSSFNGRNVASWLVRTGRWRSMWRELGVRHELVNDAPMSFTGHVTGFAGVLWDAAPKRLTDLRNREAARRVRDHAREMRLALESVSPYVAEMERLREGRIARARTHHDMQMALLLNGHMQQRCTYWHQTGELFRIGYRYPLLDVRVVGTALQLPWWAFKSQGWTRIAYRLAVEPWVPKSVVWNPLKVEPSLIAPPVTIPVGRLLPEPEPMPIADDRLASLVDIASGKGLGRRLRNESTRRDSTKRVGVMFRPDRAPRRDDAPLTQVQ